MINESSILVEEAVTEAKIEEVDKFEAVVVARDPAIESVNAVDIPVPTPVQLEEGPRTK